MNDAERKVQFSEVTELTAKAWDAVRGDDPPFDACAREFKDKLVHTAEAISKTGSGGVVGLEAFEAEVKRLLREGPPEPKEDELDAIVKETRAALAAEAERLATPEGEPSPVTDAPAKRTRRKKR